MSLKALQEKIKEYEEVRILHEDEMVRCGERLESMEKIRKEQYDIVATDNTNDLARNRLDKADKEIADLKTHMIADQHSIRARLCEMRDQILRYQEDVVDRLQTKLKAKQEVHGELKTVLIPKTEGELATLKEQARSVEEDIHALQHETQKVSGITLDDLS